MKVYAHISRTALFFCLVLLLPTLISCRRDPLSAALRQLDEDVALRGEYRDTFLNAVRPVQASLQAAADDSLRFVHAASLARLYREYSIDSVMKYSELMDSYSASSGIVQHQYSARIQQIFLSRISRNYPHGRSLAASLDPEEMVDSVRLRYYENMSLLYYSMMLRADNKRGVYLNHTRQEYRRMLSATRKGYLQIDSLSDEAFYMRLSELRDDGEYESAWQLLSDSRDRLTTDDAACSRYWRQMANMARHINRSQQKYYLVLAADYGIRSASRDMLSLSELTRMMTGSYRELQMASRFAYAAANDAARYKYPSRVNWAIDSLSIVSSALEAQVKSRNRVLMLLSVLLLFLLAFALYISRRNVNLRHRLSNSYVRLREADIIKNKYLFRYMLQLSDTFSVADNYHKELRRLARTEGPEALLKVLRASSRFESDRKKFYEAFDEMFLAVFPDFVSRVNAYMKEGCEYQDSYKGMISTELRVLAILRLGMTGSADIAHFLNCSLSTVYTYRSRAAEKSRLDREAFEKAIKSIPLL